MKTQIEFDPRLYSKLLIRASLWLVPLAALAAGLTYYLTVRQPNSYEATAVLLRDPGIVILKLSAFPLEDMRDLALAPATVEALYAKWENPSLDVGRFRIDVLSAGLNSDGTGLALSVTLPDRELALGLVGAWAEMTRARALDAADSTVQSLMDEVWTSIPEPIPSAGSVSRPGAEREGALILFRLLRQRQVELEISIPYPTQASVRTLPSPGQAASSALAAGLGALVAGAAILLLRTSFAKRTGDNA